MQIQHAMNIKQFLCASLMVCMPMFAHAAGTVVINEIAWMGTQASASDEWIELYNNTQGAIDLSGWTLSLYKPATTTPSKTITLSGSIPAQGFYVIERTNDTTISDIPADLVSSFGTGLVDSGMVIQLMQNGTMIDRTPDPCNNTWCAGSNTPKMSMERINPDGDGAESSNWATNTDAAINGRDAAGNLIHGTPKATNSVFSVSETTTSSNTGSTVMNVTSQSETNGTSVPVSGSGSPEPSHAALPPQPTFSVDAGENRTVLAGAVVEFIARSSVKNDALGSFRYTWNFGDGTIREGRAVNHVYLFPGNYTANVSMASEELAASDIVRISVVPPLLLFSEIKPGEQGFIELYNAGKTRIDAGGLILTDGVQTFTVPNITYLDAGGVLVLANRTTNITGGGNNFFLNSANGIRVDAASISGAFAEKESFVRSGNIFVKTAEASPGIYKPSPDTVSLSAHVAQKETADRPKRTKQTTSLTPSDRNDNGNIYTNAEENVASNTNTIASVSDIFSKWNKSVAFGVITLFGISVSIGFLWFRGLL